MIFRTSLQIEPAALAALLPLTIVAAIIFAPSARAALIRLWAAMWR